MILDETFDADDLLRDADQKEVEDEEVVQLFEKAWKMVPIWYN